MTFSTARPVRDLLPVALRDAARTVIALRHGNAPSLEVLRQDADAQIAGLREELQRRGHPRDVIDDALYAHCALLDEAALNGLNGTAHDAWEREPLQLRVFGRNDAGEELLRRIGQRLHEAKPVLPLLGIFAAVLELGFKGRYAVNGSEARTKLISSLNGRIGHTPAGSTDRKTPAWSDPVVVNPSRRRRRPLSALAWVLVAAIAAGVVWLAIDRWLLSSVAAMAH